MTNNQELPKGWVEVTLGDVCEHVERSSPDKLFSNDFNYIDIGSSIMLH